jgi:uncharacterized ion transporter superfamily protein YfcC
MESVSAEQPSVMSTGLKFGLIVGLASIVYNIVIIALGYNPYINSWRGFIAIALTITIIVFAHKNFKESGDGFMSFGQGVGLTLIAMIVSTVLTLIFTYSHLTYLSPATWEEIWIQNAEDMAAKGQSEDQIKMGTEWGKKLFYIIYVVIGTFFGLIIGLIVSIFTQKKRPEQAF